MKLFLHPFNLRIKERFTIAHTTRDSQEALVVELEDTDSSGSLISGLGETTANPYYHVDLPGMQQELDGLRETIENYRISDRLVEGGSEGTPEHFWQIMHLHLADSPFTLCALDIAGHDLYGKKVGQPLYQLWGLDPTKVPVSNYTIGIDSIETMARKLDAVRWPIYKIKLGTQEDLAIIRELRKHTDALFRVDANCAWGVEETIKNARELKKLGVEFIEQPLTADNREGMKEVMQYSRLPLIADESCIAESDVARCDGYFHGINIKLTKCGGITPARRMIAEARRRGLRVMVGCMTESTVGISAIAHLAPLLDYVDMDGAMLLAEDVATGVRVTESGVEFPSVNGTGAQLLPNVSLRKI